MNATAKYPRNVEMKIHDHKYMIPCSKIYFIIISR